MKNLALLCLLLFTFPAEAASVFSHNLMAPVAIDQDANGNLWQKFKLSFGADGTQTDISAANPLPMTVTTSSGKTSVALVRNVYSSVNVTTSAYVQLVASLAQAVTRIQLFDSSGQTLVIATGGSGSEVDQFYISPGVSGTIDLAIPAATRVAVKAVSATASTGELDLTFLK